MNDYRLRALQNKMGADAAVNVSDCKKCRTN